MLELGADFTFVGEQFRLQIGGRDFFVDLLFFHRGLNCLVAVDLKVDEFQPEHLGKLEFYLEALDRDVRKPHERPSIGVLLCATKDREVVEYALSRALSPALVAEYWTRLPDKQLLQAKLHEFYELAASASADKSVVRLGWTLLLALLALAIVVLVLAVRYCLSFGPRRVDYQSGGSMSVPRRNPTIRAAELTQLVLSSISTLRDVLAEEKRSNPHIVMSAVFDHAMQAIRDGDLQEVIHCFQLLKHLVELDRECDIFVNSAIWVSCLRRFPPDDPQGLSLFREIDPGLRKTLYTPFTFPHTWLRETSIHLDGADRWRSRLTVEREVESEIRLVRQMSCPGHYAVVRLRLAPKLTDPFVLFCNCLEETENAPLAYVEAIVQGVTESLAGWSEKNRGIGYLQVDLLRLNHHPVDSRWSDFVSVAGEAVKKCVAETGLLEL